MAFKIIAYKDLRDDEIGFKNIYGESMEDFIKGYGEDIIEIDLQNKVVVSISSSEYNNIPVCIHGFFIPEGERLKYKSKLIYAGHIAFIVVNFENGKQRIFYKDDECHPEGFYDCISSGDVLYYAEENGFTKEDIFLQIERTIQINHDFRFELDVNNLVMLQGL